MKFNRNDYDILRETGLTSSEIEKKSRYFDYMIYETNDFTHHFLDYMRVFECGPDEIKGFVNLIFGNHIMVSWYIVDFPDGDSYLVNFLI